MNAFINRVAGSNRKRLAELKEKGLRRYLADNGAIDLASIMVGVIVIGIIGGVIAAAVFGVIPWSQEKAASQNLDAVKTAESVQYAQSQEDPAGAKYLSATDLADATKTASKTVLLKQVSTVDIVTSASGDAWIAVSKSSNGKHFYITSDDTTPSQTVPTAFATAHTITIPATGPWA